MRICFVNTLYSRPADRGGLGAHMADLSQALAQLGHDVTILTSGDPGESRERAVRVVRLGRVDPYSRSTQLLHPRFAFDRLHYMRRLRRKIAAGRFDVVEAADGGFEHLFLFRKREAAIVTKLHGSFKEIHGERPVIGQLVSWCERAAVRASDAVYASARSHADAARMAFGLPPDRVQIIPYVVELKRSTDSRADARAEVDREFPQVRGRRVVLLSVGNSPGRKGARILLEAARAQQWPGIMFVLICADPSIFDARDVPPNVVVLKTLPRDSFRRLLAVADVVVFPSTFESFSIATHEAMLVGARVIVSKHIPLDPPAALYPRMTALDRADTPALVAALGDALERSATEPACSDALLHEMTAAYGKDAVAAATVRLYEAAVRSRQVPAPASMPLGRSAGGNIAPRPGE